MTGIKNKKWISILLAAAMTLGMTGCSGSAEKEPAVETTAVEEEGRESAQAQETEAEEEETAGEEEQENAQAAQYSVTEENDNKELTMNRQPESSYWFPAGLLEWKAEEDEDLRFNVQQRASCKARGYCGARDCEFHAE